MPKSSLLVPETTDEDIDWIRDVMGLEVFDAPRRGFLAARSTLDVSACPGSGKTTLVVAKLAMLARKWPHRTKGICVLSHTNVAREEIRQRLGSTDVGQRLLGYPHFIDTIHRFVNRFLALPWLNSNGFPSPTVDNDVTTAFRRGVIGTEYWTVQNFLAKKHSGFDRLRICARDLSFDLGGKAFPAGPGARSFDLAKQAIETAAQAGYFCYDEMFVWARALLEDFPAAASWLRRRFPLVILDEMQDTFELQGTVLHEVFPRSSDDIVVQRVGDPNQAIFDDSETQPDKSDPFPDTDGDRCLTIPNSYRFGPEIATLASPFAVTAVGNGGLCGIGPKAIAGAPAAGAHAIFVFLETARQECSMPTAGMSSRPLTTASWQRARSRPWGRCIRRRQMLRRATHTFRSPCRITGNATQPRLLGRSRILNPSSSMFARHAPLYATAGTYHQALNGWHLD